MHVLIAIARELRGACVPMIDRCVLLALADRADANGKSWPSLATIARDIDASRSGVIVSVRRLVERGMLSATLRPRGGANGQDSTVYVVDATAIKRALEALGLTSPARGPVQGVDQSTGWTSPGDGPRLVHQVDLTSPPGRPEDPHLKIPIEDPQPPVGDAPRAPAVGGSSSGSSKPQTRKATKGKTKPQKAEPTPEEQAGRGMVLGAYREAYAAARGTKPLTEGKTLVDALRLVRALGADAAVELVRNAYQRDDTKGWATLATIVKDPDRYRGAGPTKRGPAVQSTAGRGWTPQRFGEPESDFVPPSDEARAEAARAFGGIT